MLRECDTRQMTDGEIREAFVKCFAGREGMIVLSHLKRLTLRRWLGRTLPPMNCVIWKGSVIWSALYWHWRQLINFL